MNTADLFLWILDNLNYWVVTLFMAIESSFVPFPSEVVVPPAAWKAMDPASGMSFVLVIVFATLGADLGALINYGLAKWVGRPIIYRFADSRIGHMCLIDRAKVETAEEYFRKHGAASTIFGRLVPAVRQLISIPAGLAGMHVGKFLLYTTLAQAYGTWCSPPSDGESINIPTTRLRKTYISKLLSIATNWAISSWPWLLSSLHSLLTRD